MEAATDSSLLGSIRARRAQRAKEVTNDIAIPGYGGELVCRYRLLDPLVEGKEIGQRVQKQYPKAEDDADRIHFALLDTLIEACVGFYGRLPDGTIVPLGEMLDDPKPGFAPTYSDPELGEALGFDVDSARAAVVEVFNGNRITAGVHAQQVQEWMADTSGELNRGVGG